MKRLLLFLTAAVPLSIGVISVQSCGGEGGAIGGGGGGGGTNITEEFLALLPAGQRGASYVGSTTCGQSGCHGSLDHGDTYAEWFETRHRIENVGCESCHGPGSAHAANPDGDGVGDNILTFPKVTSAIVCAQCHGSIFDNWKESGHAHLVASPVNSASTNPAGSRSSRCIACHSGLFRTQVYEHGNDFPDLSDNEIRTIADNTLQVMPHTATCATCHDPHMKTGNLTTAGKEAQLRHPVFNTDSAPVEPGTTADVFTKFNHVCAQCHNGRGANGSDTALTSGTSRPNMHDSNQYNMLMGFGGVEGGGPIIRNMAHATAPGQCSHCHMPNARHTFTVSYDTGCAPCHTAADAAARTAAIANEITNALYVIRTRMENWSIARFSGDPAYASVSPLLIPHLWEYSSLLSEIATELGVTTAGIPSNHQSANVPIQIKRARHNYYFIIRDSSICPHNPPYARHLITVASDNLTSIGADSAQGSLRNISTRQMHAILEADKARAKRADQAALFDD